MAESFLNYTSQIRMTEVAWHGSALSHDGDLNISTIGREWQWSLCRGVLRGFSASQTDATTAPVGAVRCHFSLVPSYGHSIRHFSRPIYHPGI